MPFARLAWKLPPSTLIYILRFWTLDAIDLWGAIGPGRHDDLVGGLARSGSSPGN